MQTLWADRVLQLTYLTDAETIAARLQEMLNEGFRLDEPLAEMENAPPLMLVVVEDNANYPSYPVLSEILRLGANPNIQKVVTGETPLMAAMHVGDTGRMKTLLNAGADTEIQDDKGQTALHHAAGNLNPKAVDLLLRHGANRFHRNHENGSVADKARASGVAFTGQAPLTLGWSPQHQAASDAAVAERVEAVIALLEDSKAAA